MQLLINEIKERLKVIEDNNQIDDISKSLLISELKFILNRYDELDNSHSEFNPDPEVALIIESNKVFFDSIPSHFHLLNTNEEYKQRVSTYSKNRRFSLDITVKNSEMTHFLLKWMYGSYKGKPNLVFGCLLNEIKNMV